MVKVVSVRATMAAGMLTSWVSRREILHRDGVRIYIIRRSHPLHQTRDGQSALAALASGDLTHGPERESLEEFLSELPGLWRAGEVRPTHRKGPATPHTWSTRKDPFEGVRPEILLW